MGHRHIRGGTQEGLQYKAGGLSWDQSVGRLGISRLRPVWDDLRENFPALLDEEFLDFVNFSAAVRWPFFSSRVSKFIPPAKSTSAAADAYSLAAEDLLSEDTRSPEKKASDDAEWKAIEKSRKEERWTKRVMVGGKRVKRFLEWVARRRERYNTHLEDHLRWVPFKWMTMRDCPMCQFGEREWWRWEAIAQQLDLSTWVESGTGLRTYADNTRIRWSWSGTVTSTAALRGRK